jgi:membrane protein
MRANEVWSKLKPGRELIRETLDQFSRDRGDLVAAALAFYTLLSIAPLIIIAVAIAGAVLGRGAAREEVTRVLTDTMGTAAASAIEGWVDEASRSGGVASLIGALLMLFTASRLATQLRSALNQVWNVDEFQAEGFRSIVKHQIRRRLFAFVMVLAVGPVLLIVLISRALLIGLHQVLFASSALAGIAVQVSQLLFSIGLVTVITAIVFKVVPDTRVGWRSVWVGGLLTSLLFNAGNLVVGLYLGRLTVAATYGAAGSAVVVLLWLYFSSQLFLLGAEFTQAYASRFGRGLKPNEERDVAQAEAEGRRARDMAMANGARASHSPPHVPTSSHPR